MIDWNQHLNNPNFQALPDAEKKKVIDALTSQDRDFLNLPAQEQTKVKDALYAAASPEYSVDENDPYPGSTRFASLLRFSPLLHDPTLEGKVREAEARRYQGLTAEQATEKDRQQAGLGSDIVNAINQSTVGKILYSFVSPEERSRIDQIQPEGYQYKPKHELLSDLARFGTDLPLYAAGGALGGTPGAFMLPAGLDALYNAKLSGQLPNKWFGKEGDLSTFMDLTPEERQNLTAVEKKIGQELGIEWIKGRLMMGAGKLAGMGADKLSQLKLLERLPRGVLEGTLDIPLGTGAMMGTDVTAGQLPFTGREPVNVTSEMVEKNLVQYAILKALGIPGMMKGPTGKEVKFISESTEMKPADVLKTLKEPDGPERIQKMAEDVRVRKEQEAQVALDEAKSAAQEAGPRKTAYARLMEEAERAKGAGMTEAFQAGAYRDALKERVERLEQAVEKGRMVNMAPEKLTKLETLMDDAKAKLKYFDQKFGEQGIPEIPKEALEKNPADVEPREEVVYPPGWDKRQQKSTGTTAYQGRPKAREGIDEIVNTWWTTIKQATENDPSLMKNLVKDKSLKGDYLDIKGMSADAQKILEKPAYKARAEKELQMMIDNYQEAGDIGQVRKWQEWEKPYRVLKTPGGPEENRIAFEEMMKSYTPADNLRPAEVKKIKEELAKPIIEPKTEAEKIPGTYSQREWQEIQGRVGAFNKAMAIPEYTEAELGKKGFKLYDKFKGSIEGAKDLIREVLSVEPGDYMKLLAPLDGVDKRYQTLYHHWIGQFLNNPSREIRLAGGLPMVKWFNAPWRAADHIFGIRAELAKQRNNTFKESFNPSRQEIENAGLNMIGRQIDGPKILEAMGKEAPKLTEREQKMVDYIDDQLTRLLPQINAAREAAGLPGFEGRDQYFTFLRKFTWAEEMGYSPVLNDAVLQLNEPSHPKAFSFRFWKKRIEGSERPVETDALYVLSRYENAALRTICMSPVIGKLRDITNTGSFAVRNPKFHAILEGALDYMAGVGRGKEGEIDYSTLERAADRVSRGLTAFYLAGNLGSIAMQPAAYANTLVMIGPKYATKGIGLAMNPKNWNEAITESHHLKSRVMDISILENEQGFAGKLGRLHSKAVELGMKPIEYTDFATAVTTWLGTREYVKEKMGLTGRDANIMADELTVATQGSAGRLDVAWAQRTPVGKLLTKFQTFVINQWNWMLKDVAGKENPNITASQGAFKVGGLIATAALANTVYEMAGYLVPPVISNTPFPAPISALYKAMDGQGFFSHVLGQSPWGEEKTQDKGVPGALRDAALEAMGVIPVVGGGIKYGEPFGAAPSSAISLTKTMSGSPEGKPWWYQVLKVAQVPGGQQIWKMFKAYQRMERAQKPVSYESLMRQVNKDAGITEMNKSINNMLKGKD